MTTNPNVYYGKRRKLPFELGRGHFVCHDGNLVPKHRKIGWDDRCAACRAVREYLRELDEKLLRQVGTPTPPQSALPPQTPAMPTGRVKAHVSSLVGA